MQEKTPPKAPELVSLAIVRLTLRPQSGCALDHRLFETIVSAARPPVEADMKKGIISALISDQLFIELNYTAGGFQILDFRKFPLAHGLVSEVKPHLGSGGTSIHAHNSSTYWNILACPAGIRSKTLRALDKLSRQVKKKAEPDPKHSATLIQCERDISRLIALSQSLHNLSKEEISEINAVWRAPHLKKARLALLKSSRQLHAFADKLVV